ncbi:MAG: hypothetical protein GY856_34410 [bacterium]|nr:hypothetical protein [bacterium]
MRRSTTRLLLLISLTALPLEAAEPGDARAEHPVLKAPTRLYTEPNAYMLLKMGGDRAHFRYTPGSLDRAANLQQRLDVASRGFERWTKNRIEFIVYVLNREEWEQTGYSVVYGVPVRVGSNGLAVPAYGDDETVRLWARLLKGILPSVPGTPLRGTPQQAATLMVADVLVQLQASEMLVDAIGLGGDDHWVRGVMAHLAALTVAARLGTDRLSDLELMYRQLIDQREARAWSVRDYHADLTIEDWLWFQGQFHFGARALYDDKGKDALKKMVKLRKRRDGGLRGELLLDRYKGLNQWFRSSFSAVSLRTD